MLNAISSLSDSDSAGSEPFLLAVNVNRGRAKRDFEYLTRVGTLINDPKAGVRYQIRDGQLRSSTGFVSTSGLVRFQPFAASNVVLPESRLFEISNGSLEWNSDGFYGGQARFCLSQSVESFVSAVFLQPDPPDGCALINLTVVYVKDVLELTASSTATTTSIQSSRAVISSTTSKLGGGTPSINTSSRPSTTSLPSPSTIFAQLAIAEPVACFQSDPSALVIPGPGYLVSTLEQCVDYCAGFSGSVSYNLAGVQFGK